MVASLEERVLIVEDEWVQALDLQETLMESGFYVIGTTDRGEDAVQICADLEPTLVLMDISLAGNMKGTEAARQIQRRFSIPVVFLTSYEDEQSFDEACQSWPYGYLNKPCRDTDLVRTLKLAAQQGRRQKIALQADVAASELHESSANRIRVSDLACYQLFSGSLSMVNGSVRLTPKEQKFLDLLGRNLGRVVSFERIFTEVWDDKIDSFQPLRILVHRLRRKLGAGDGIENIFEMGYRLNVLPLND